jgi:hypothetical protein
MKWTNCRSSVDKNSQEGKTGDGIGSGEEESILCCVLFA